MINHRKSTSPKLTEHILSTNIYSNKAGFKKWGTLFHLVSIISIFHGSFQAVKSPVPRQMPTFLAGFATFSSCAYMTNSPYPSPGDSGHACYMWIVPPKALRLWSEVCQPCTFDEYVVESGYQPKHHPNLPNLTWAKMRDKKSNWVTVWRCFQTELVTLQVKHLLQSSSASKNRRCSIHRVTHATGSNSRFLWLPWPPGEVFVARPSRAHPFSPEHPIAGNLSTVIHSTSTSLGCNLSNVIKCIANVLKYEDLCMYVYNIYMYNISTVTSTWIWNERDKAPVTRPTADFLWNPVAPVSKSEGSQSSTVYNPHQIPFVHVCSLSIESTAMRNTLCKSTINRNQIQW